MSRSEELKLIITGDSRNLGNVLRQSERDLGGYTARAGRMFSSVHATINSGLKRMIVNPITGMASAAGVMMLGKQIIEFDRSLVQMANNGWLTQKSMLGLRQTIIDDAMAVGQSRESILAGISTIVDRSGNLEFAVKNIKSIGLAATATGASVEDMASLASNLNEKMKLDNVTEALNAISVQGKTGAFTLRDMAAQGNRLFSAGSTLGMSGIDDLRKFGAVIQYAMKGTSSPEQAATAVERSIGNIIDKQNEIKKNLGFDIFIDKASNKYKSIDTILKGIIVGAKGNQKVLNDIFGQEGIRGVNALTDLYRSTGGFNLFDNLVNADAEHATDLMDDFSRVAKTASFALSRLQEVGKKFADSGLSKSIEEMGKSLEKFMADPEKIDKFNETLKNIGIIAKYTARGLGGAAGSIVELASIPGDIEEAIKNPGKEWNANKEWNRIPKTDRQKLNARFGFQKFYGNNMDKYWSGMQSAVATYKNENHIALSVHIDPAGNVSTRTDNLDTHVKVSSNRGNQSAMQ